MYFNLPLPKGLPSFPPPKVSRTVRARLDPHRHDPRHTHSRSTALAQLMTTEYEAARDAHLNHIYHPVTGTKETYDSLRSQNPDRWETSFSNEIGRLAQGVGDRMKSGNENIFLSLDVKFLTAGKSLTQIQSVIIVPSNPTSTASV